MNSNSSIESQINGKKLKKNKPILVQYALISDINLSRKSKQYIRLNYFESNYAEN